MPIFGVIRLLETIGAAKAYSASAGALVVVDEASAKLEQVMPGNRDKLEGISEELEREVTINWGVAELANALGNAELAAAADEAMARQARLRQQLLTLLNPRNKGTRLSQMQDYIPTPRLSPPPTPTRVQEPRGSAAALIVCWLAGRVGCRLA